MLGFEYSISESSDEQYIEIDKYLTLTLPTRLLVGRNSSPEESMQSGMLTSPSKSTQRMRGMHANVLSTITRKEDSIELLVDEDAREPEGYSDDDEIGQCTENADLYVNTETSSLSSTKYLHTRTKESLHQPPTASFSTKTDTTRSHGTNRTWMELHQKTLHACASSFFT